LHHQLQACELSQQADAAEGAAGEAPAAGISQLEAAQPTQTGKLLQLTVQNLGLWQQQQQQQQRQKQKQQRAFFSECDQSSAVVPRGGGT
jgi:hypothetical protein